MSTVATKAAYTPEDLLALPDGVRYELVDGNLVERDMGNYASWIGGRLFRLLSNFCEEHRLGWVLPADAGYQCFPDEPNKVRKPDVSFIAMNRIPDGRLPGGHSLIPPDLAVEVLSPNDLASEIDDKVEDYLRAGVRLVWVVNPERRTVRVHRADKTGAFLDENDEISGEDVVPGFRCSIGELIPLPGPVDRQ